MLLDYVSEFIVKAYEKFELTLQLFEYVTHADYILIYCIRILWFMFYSPLKYTTHSFIYGTNSDGPILDDDFYPYHH